jgi:hypothetical protein
MRITRRSQQVLHFQLMTRTGLPRIRSQLLTRLQWTSYPVAETFGCYPVEIKESSPLVATTASELPNGIGKVLRVICSVRDNQYNASLTQRAGMFGGFGSR